MRCASNNLRERVPLRSRGRVLATAGRPRAGPEPWQIKKRDFIGGDGPFFGSSSGGGQGGRIGGRRARSQYRRRRIDARGAYRTRWPCDHRSTGTYACKMGATTSAPGLPRHDANQRVLDHVGNLDFTISREWPSATNASTAPAFQAARSARGSRSVPRRRSCARNDDGRRYTLRARGSRRPEEGRGAAAGRSWRPPKS